LPARRGGLHRYRHPRPPLASPGRGGLAAQLRAHVAGPQHPCWDAGGSDEQVKTWSVLSMTPGLRLSPGAGVGSWLVCPFTLSPRPRQNASLLLPGLGNSPARVPRLCLLLRSGVKPSPGAAPLPHALLLHPKPCRKDFSLKTPGQRGSAKSKAPAATRCRCGTTPARAGRIHRSKPRSLTVKCGVQLAPQPNAREHKPSASLSESPGLSTPV